MKVGVLALQGAFARHVEMLQDLGIAAVEVRTTAQLADVDAMVLPGGESTTISMLLERSGLFDPLAGRLRDGMPALGTCAGAILLSSEILDGRSDQRNFGVLSMKVRRNGYGRQVDSFEADLAIAAGDAAATADPGTMRVAFIRAPRIVEVGPDVEVLAEVGGDPVLCRQGSVLASTFHPELGADPRVHEIFLSRV